jgi:hypothetical protein
MAHNWYVTFDSPYLQSPLDDHVEICIPTCFDVVTLADLMPNLGIAQHPLHTNVSLVKVNIELTLP